MLDSDGSPKRDDRHHRRSRFRSPVSPGCAGETLAEREERRLAEAAVSVGPPAGQPRAARADPGLSAQGPAPTEETAPPAQAGNPVAPPPEGAPGAQGAETAAPAGHATAPTDYAAAPGTPTAQEIARARALGTSPGAAAAAAGGREGAKYRAHTNPSHNHTSPTKPYPPKAAFTKGRLRPVRPPVPVRTPPGITLPQLRRQQNIRRGIKEGGDGAQTGQGAGHGSAQRGTGGDRASAQGQAQGTGLGARGKERGRRRGPGAEASSSGGGQSTGSRRHDTGHGAGKGQGHGKDTQEREQGAKAGGHGAHGAERGAVGERGRSQGHGHGHGRVRALACGQGCR